MNNNWKFFLHKYRSSIAIGITVLVCILMLVAMFLLVNDNDDKPIISWTPKTEYADYYITAHDNKLSLYDLSGIKSSELEYKELILPTELQEELIVYSNGYFRKITIEKAVSGDNKYRLVENKVREYTHSIADYSYNDNYIIVKRNDGSFEVLERDSDTVLIFEPEKKAEKFLVTSKHLIYSSENTLNSIEIKTKKEISIDVGSTTFALATDGTNVFAFNNFGNGKGTTSVFVLNPSDLYIQNVFSQKSLNVYPLLKGVFIQRESALQIFNYKDEKYGSKTLTIKSGENSFDMKNTILIDDYLYTNKDGSIVIISLKDQLIKRTLEIESDYFWPVFMVKK